MHHRNSEKLIYIEEANKIIQNYMAVHKQQVVAIRGSMTKVYGFLLLNMTNKYIKGQRRLEYQMLFKMCNINYFYIHCGKESH